MKTLYKIILIGSISIGIFLTGYSFYKINQELQIIKLERAENERIAKEKIKTLGEEIEALKEKLAEQAIGGKGPFVEKTKANLIEIAKSTNKEYYLRKKALGLSNNVKGVYITKHIANSGSKDLYAKKVLDDILKLVDETELNAVVIDVKEVDGFKLSDNLKDLIIQLHQKNIWVIARFVSFRDSSLIKERPELYLKQKDGRLWRDEKGYYWLDPASFQVQKYLIDLSYKVIDFGFDEIQFDYIRFPAKDRGAVYPIYNKKSKEKQEVIRDFYLKLRNNLRFYKPDIVLSCDLFGETATRSVSSEIGQNLADVVGIFDYVSFMLYPSHFFQGFEVGKDLKRGLAYVYFPYESEDIAETVSEHPYEVVLRSIFSASDKFLRVFSENEFQPYDLGKESSFLYCPMPRIRPWLQDFDLKADTSRGIFYDAKKVRDQIRAAEDAGASGWLLWNPSNIYTKEALKD